MKALLILALLPSLSLADVTDKLVGRWAGTVTATSNGVAVSQNTKVTYTRLGKKGLLAITTITIPGQPQAKGVSRFRDNGKTDGELYRNGSVIAVVSGTWTATNSVLKSNVKAEGLFPSFRITSKSTVTGSNISAVGTTSTGERSVGSLKKK